MARLFCAALAVFMMAVIAACSAGGTASNQSPPPSVDAVTPAFPSPTTLAGVPRFSLSRLQTAHIDLDSPDWLTEFDGSLWVRLDSGYVVRVDPMRARVLAEIAPEGESQFSACQGLGAGLAAVWACGDAFVQRIDPVSNTIVETFDLDVSDSSGHIAAVDGSVWLLSSDGHSLIPIDEATHEVAEAIDLGFGCEDLAARGSSIWVACPFDDAVLVVDAESRAVTSRLAIDEPSAVTAGRYVWVTSAEGVVQVSPDDLTVKALVDVGDVASADVTEGRDTAWVRTEGGPFLVGIDIASGEPFARITSSDLRSGGNSLVIDGQVWATAYDDATLVRLRPPPN